MKPDTLVLALGNPLRADDDSGNAVLRYLRQRTLPETITLQNGGTPGLETILILQDYQYVVIIDAAEMALDAGEWRRFDYTAIQAASDQALQGTLHDAGLYEALALGDVLGILPKSIIIYGIQPACLDWKIGLSAPVQAVLPVIADAIFDELRENKRIDHVHI